LIVIYIALYLLQLYRFRAGCCISIFRQALLLKC